MKRTLMFLLLSSAMVAYAQESLLRIDCLEGTNGAKVYIDNEYRFECFDYEKKPVLLTSGEHVVRVVLSIDESYERVFNEVLSLEAGVPKRLRVSLPEQTLTTFGKQEQARKAEEAKAKAESRAAEEKAKAEREKLLADKLALEQDIAGAESGDLSGMERMAARYKTGDGVPVDEVKAAYWDKRAKDRAREARIESLERSKMPFLGSTRDAWGHVEAAFESGSYFLGASMAPSTVIFVPFDIIFSPWTTTDHSLIDSEISELRMQSAASRWANPDAMIARVANTED